MCDHRANKKSAVPDAKHTTGFLRSAVMSFSISYGDRYSANLKVIALESLNSISLFRCMATKETNINDSLKCFDFYVYSGGQTQIGKRVNDFRRRVKDINQALVHAHLVLLPRIFMHKA